MYKLKFYGQKPVHLFRTMATIPTQLLQTVKDGVQISCHIQPGCKVEEIKIIENSLNIKTNAQPKDNEANTEIIKVLSKLLGISKSNLHIIRGQKDRNKIVVANGISLEKVKEILDKL